MVSRFPLYCLLVCCVFTVSAQDLLLFQKSGLLAPTRSYPGAMIQKKVNLSLPGIQGLAMTDGPTINQLTKTNQDEERYLALEQTPKSLTSYSNIYGELDIHTVDAGIRLGSYGLLAGHAFRRQGNIRYAHGLAVLASQGNSAFIGQAIEIGPKIDVQAYNEFYLGLQKTFGKLSMGFRAKLLYGTASLYTERSSITFTTHPENYAFELKNDYLVRSSGLLRYYGLDSITVARPGFTFDNLFFNNAGIGMDLGLVYAVNDRFTMALSALDVGKINWDFFPREYKSKGTFSFEGLDLAQYIGDTTSIQVDDTLLQIVDVESGQKAYSTALPTRFILAASYQSGPWTLNGQWCMRHIFGDWMHALAVAGLRQMGPIAVGIQCSASKNQNPTRPGLAGSFGGLVSFNIGPVYGFLSSDGLPGLFQPAAYRRASLNAGCSIQF